MKLDEFKTRTIEPTLVMLSTKTCPPCKKMKPIVDEFAKDYKVLMLDANESKDIVSMYEVKSVPTFLMMAEGELVARTSGTKTIDQLQEFFNQVILYKAWNQTHAYFLGVDMEFPKIGDKYRSKYNGTTVKVLDVDRGERTVQLEGEIVRKYYMDYWYFRDTYSKIPLEIELGSRWLLPNGRLITVYGKNHGQINYYFGEAYCFTKVCFSKYEHNFLSECSPFTGDLDDYNTSGDRVVPLEATGTVEITSSDDSVTVKTSGDYIISQNAENRVMSTDTGMMFSTKKPLWKRILRKLV